jgi:hypothetical protein
VLLHRPVEGAPVFGVHRAALGASLATGLRVVDFRAASRGVSSARIVSRQPVERTYPGMDLVARTCQHSSRAWHGNVRVI